MSRLGADWQQAGQFAQFVQELPRLHIASVYSHFATADSPDTTIYGTTAWKIPTGDRSN